MRERFDSPEIHFAWRILDLARFWARIKRAGVNECWLWRSDHIVGGYGAFSMRHKVIGAHRFALELHLGRALRSGVHVLHSCDNKLCCNPRHLREGTARENCRDAVTRGQIPVGEDRWTAKLTEKQVRAIKRLRKHGIRVAVIAKRFKIGVTQVYRIAKGTRWGHLK